MPVTSVPVVVNVTAKPAKNGTRALGGRAGRRSAETTQDVTATKCDSTTSCQVGVVAVLTIGTQEAIIGTKRSAESATPMAAATREAPLAIAPTSTTWLGSAQIIAVVNTAWPRVNPASRQSTPKPNME